MSIRNGSILNTIKHSRGCETNELHFDSEIIMHINSAFSVLFQRGLGSEAFRIENEQTTWGEVTDDNGILSMVREYVDLSVWRTFDPPTSGYVLEDIKSRMAELEWRIESACDPKNNNPLHPEVN